MAKRPPEGTQRLELESRTLIYKYEGKVLFIFDEDTQSWYNPVEVFTKQLLDAVIT